MLIILISQMGKRFLKFLHLCFGIRADGRKASEIGSWENGQADLRVHLHPLSLCVCGYEVGLLLSLLSNSGLLEAGEKEKITS